MKAILIINPSSGKMKRKMPPVLRWTLNKLERRLSGLFKPKITEDNVIEEVKKKCDKTKIKLDIEFTKYPKHATKLAEAAKDIYDLIIAAGGDGTIGTSHPKSMKQAQKQAVAIAYSKAKKKP